MEHRTMIVIDNGKNFEECRCGSRHDAESIRELIAERRFRENVHAFFERSRMIDGSKYGGKR